LEKIEEKKLEEIKKYEEEIKNIVNIQIFNSNNKKIKV
jgi:hypothetical protein